MSSLEKGSDILLYPLKTRYSEDDIREIKKEKFNCDVVKIFSYFPTDYKWILELIVVLLSIVWCILYIVETYATEYEIWMYIVDILFAMGFLVFFLLSLYMAENRLRYLISPFAFVDYLTIIPAFFDTSGSFKIIRIIAVLRIFRLTRIFFLIKTHSTRKIAEFAFTIVTLIFISTCVLLFVEPGSFKSFHRTFYFVIVTITTVGYGDVVAHTAIGQFLVVMMVLSALTLIPVQGYYLNKYLREQKSKYEYSYNIDQSHVLVMGCITPLTLELFMRSFIKENSKCKVVVLHPTDPFENEDIGKVLYMKRFIYVLYYFKGSPLIKEDLSRVHIDTAQACFVLNNPGSNDPGNTDKDILLTCLSVSSYRPDLPLYIQLLSTNYMGFLGSCPPSILYIDRIKAGILAQSAFVPGYCSIIESLLRSHSTADTVVSLKNTVGIHSVYLNSPFHSKQFTEVAEELLKQNITLFAIERKKKIHINPGRDYIITGREKAYFIANDKTRVLRVGSPVGSQSVRRTKEKRRLSMDEDININFDKEIKNISENSSVPYNMTAHIIVICGRYDILPLAKALRSIKTEKLKPIVFLLDSTPNQQLWESVRNLPEIYFVKGSPLNHRDLINVRTQHASKVLLLKSFASGEKHLSQSLGTDREILLAYVTLKQLVSDINICFELSDIHNFGILQKSSQYPEYKEYLQGIILDVSILHSITVQSYFEPNFLQLIETLVIPDSSSLKIDLLPIPDDIKGSTYDYVVSHFIAQNESICIGLYKLNENQPYVQLSPPRNTTIERGDLVYVITKQQSLK